MQAFSALVPKLIPWIGKLVSVIGTGLAVDTVIGSPIQRKLGIANDDYPKVVDYDLIESERVAKVESRSRAEGLVNYLASLQALAPGFVDRNRSQLRSNYTKAIDKRQALVNEAEKEV
jgi:hypothetical protein